MIKLELAKSVLHAVALVLHFNGRVPIFDRGFVEILRVWIPVVHLDIPMRVALDPTLASAQGCMADALLVRRQTQLRM